MDDQSLLLQILEMNGDDVDQHEIRERLMARAAENNPQFALLARYLAMRQTSAEAKTPDVAFVEPDDDIAQQDEQNRREAHVQRMNAELRLLRDRTHALAEALGACADCWGTDPDCRRCRGDGAPGALVPDVRLFRELVMPAIRRLKRWYAGRSAVNPSAPSIG